MMSVKYAVLFILYAKEKRYFYDESSEEVERKKKKMKENGCKVKRESLNLFST